MSGIIIYWTMTGNTEDIANKIAKDTKFDLKPLSEATVEEALNYNIVLLGCPAMGDEVLEETEFEPFYNEFKSKASGHKVALFGSYGWGGSYMEDWIRDAKNNGLDVVASIKANGDSSDLDEDAYNEFLANLK
jgi:flavodoxin short chain